MFLSVQSGMSCESKQRINTVKVKVFREHTFIHIVSLENNIILTFCIFFLEWHFVLKVLKTFTFIQPKRKHLWDVKIAFGDKKSEQEQKETTYQNILKIPHI